MEELRNRLKTAMAADEGSLGHWLASGVLYQGNYENQWRLHQRIDKLRCVEAIRGHVHKHGAFPKTLADIKVVPVPDDPMTGRPFAYELDGDAALLAGYRLTFERR